jgi:hypothetical protein
MQHIVHLQRAWPLSSCPSPALRKRIRIGAPAFETRTMTGCEGGHFIKKEQLGVAVAPDTAVPVFEVELAANPLFRRPAAPAEPLSGIVDPPAAIAHEGATRGTGKQFAEG